MMGLGKEGSISNNCWDGFQGDIVEFPSWAWEKNFIVSLLGVWVNVEDLRGSGQDWEGGILTSSPSLPLEVAWTNGKVRFGESVYGLKSQLPNPSLRLFCING